MTTTPRITVIIPTYDRPALLDEAIASALTQVPQPAVIVVDDMGPARPSASAQALDAQGVIRIVGDRNRGTPGARNFGAQFATSEFILFLDDDDQLVPGALAALEAALAADDRIPAAAGAFSLFSPEDPEGGPPLDLVDGDLTFERFVAGCAFRTVGQVLIRRSAFDAVAGFDDSCEVAEDWDLWLRLTRSGPIRCVPRHVLKYRTHGERQSTTTSVARTCVTLAERYRQRLSPAERRSLHPAMVTHVVDGFFDRLAWHARGHLRRGRWSPGFRDLGALLRLVRLGLRSAAGRDALRRGLRQHLSPEPELAPNPPPS